MPIWLWRLFQSRHASELIEALNKHNDSKGAKYTRGKKWIIIYQKKYLTKSIAMKEEYKLKKNAKLRKSFKNKYLNHKYA